MSGTATKSRYPNKERVMPHCAFCTTMPLRRVRPPTMRDAISPAARRAKNVPVPDVIPRASREYTARYVEITPNENDSIIIVSPSLHPSIRKNRSIDSLFSFLMGTRSRVDTDDTSASPRNAVASDRVNIMLKLCSDV